MRLDDFRTGEAEPSVTFLKVNAKDSEPIILRGARRLIEHCLPAIGCEINPGKLGALGRSPRETYSLLAAHGYGPWAWDDDLGSYRPVSGHPAGDILFRPTVSPGERER